MSTKQDELKPDDFLVYNEGCDLKTSKGDDIGEGKTPKLTQQIAEKLNEQAHRDDEECWSA